MDKNREQKLARSIGRSISEQRKKTGLSQEVIAEMLGIGYEAVSRMERGIIIPNIIRLIEVSEIFECSINDLISGSADTSIEIAKNISEKVKPLTHQQRSIVLNILDLLIDGFHSESTNTSL